RGAVDLLAHPAVAADPPLAPGLGDVAHVLPTDRLLLAGLAGLAQDALTGVADALALVRLGLADAADVRRHLADDLLVDARHDHLRGDRDLERDALGRLDEHRVAEAEAEPQ